MLSVSECTTESEVTIARDAASSGGIARTAFYWTSQEEELFGWLHAPQSSVSTDHVVLIAAPLGYEQLHSHRSLRHLADALAKRGIPAMRFDWHGTGDSPGIDEAPHRWTLWKRNLQDAVNFLKQHLGFRQVSVIGLRLGATLAASSFGPGEIEHLVLWAPVVTGKTYVREMTAIARTAEFAVVQTPDGPRDLEAAGFLLSEQTADEVAAINLAQAISWSCRTLIVSKDDSASDERLHAACVAAEIPTERIITNGYAAMMVDPHKSSVPHGAIHRIVEWLARQIGRDTNRDVSELRSKLGHRSITLPWHPEAHSPTHSAATIRERILPISTEPCLFGILSEPENSVSHDRPTVVLMSAGAAYRIGPGRLYVHLARRLAAAGFRCVRFDIAGLGDSVIEDKAAENQVYTATAFRDADATLQALKELRLGDKFVLMGLCSGAYNSFQSAVALENADLIESVLINPLTYFWKDGLAVEDLIDRQIAVQQQYFESAWAPAKWWKLLTGQTEIGVWGACAMVLNRLRLCRGTARTNGHSATERPLYSHPVCDDLSADLRQVVQRQRQLAMFFAESDPGHDILTHKAGRAARELQRSGNLHVEFIPQADHNFSHRSSRCDLIERVSSYLTRRYGER